MARVQKSPKDSGAVEEALEREGACDRERPEGKGVGLGIVPFGKWGEGKVRRNGSESRCA